MYNMAMSWFDDEEYISDEEDTSSRHNWRMLKGLLPYFKKYLRKITLAALLLLVSTLLTLLGPVIIKHAIDFEIPQRNLAGILILSVFYLVIQLLVVIIRYFQQIEIAVVGEKAIADLKDDLFKHILNVPVPFFDQNPVGRLITRVEGDTETLKNLFSSTAVVLAQDLALLVGMSVVMVVINFRLYLIIFAMLPIFLYGFWWFGKNVRPVYVGLRRKIAQINSFVVESLKGLHVVQAFRQEDKFIKKIDSLGQEKFDQEMKAMTFWYRIWFLVDIGEVIGIVLVLGIGGVWAMRGLVSLGALFIFISYITRLFGPLRGLSDQFNMVERAFASAERVFDILGMSSEHDRSETVAIRDFKTDIRFTGLNFAYEKDNWVLQDLNLSVNKGEKVAIIGATGAGKSSIISLLLKFYQCQTGDVLIDGLRLSTIDRKSLRKKIGFVSQDVVLFPGSVFENLRLFDDGVLAETVTQAAVRSQIHERILSFPKGYETNIIEQGINLSYGEKQLISFVRALVLDPDILILDEATSSVDPESERLIQKGMTELLQGRTAIIIAHRLTTTRLADRIFVLHQGRLVEQGTHDALLQKKGHYYSFYCLQYLDAG